MTTRTGHLQAKTAAVKSSKRILGDASKSLLCGDLLAYILAIEGLRDAGGKQELLVQQLADEIRSLMQFKKAARRVSVDSVLRESGLVGAKREVVKTALSIYSLNQLLRAHSQMIHVDKVNKGLASGDVWLEMTRMGIELMPKWGNQK